ncbi:MAG TPA: rhomboid family intramembrane serine protease [Prolixibacteraceae bacterium]|nr:rhomboid family intramembrane serine protease [Prolixibacteraceae bacterium]
MNQFQTSPFSMPPVVKNLIMINIVMLVATWALKNIGIDLNEKLGLFYPGSEYFRPYQFVTHLFMHANIWHLFFNMFALYIFGKVLEMVWGSKRFLIYFLVTGLGAAALHSFVTYLEIQSLQKHVAAFINTPSPELLAAFVKSNLSHPATWVADLVNNWGVAPNNPVYIQQATDLVQRVLVERIDIPTIGASGAVFGVLLAFGYLFPNTELMLLFPPVPIKAKYFVIGYGAIELYMGITQSNSNIAHFAHLGGMLFGFILLKYWEKSTKKFY